MTERNPYHPDGLWPTAGSYTRTESPDLLDGGMMCAGIEAEAASDTLLLVQQQRDQATTRAEKAEQERDKARGALRARLGVLAVPRPLTPDAITDEMVERAIDAWVASGDERDTLLGDAMRAALTAALTEPPTRPEGAEEIHRVLDAIYQDEPGITHRGNLADTLATYGVRVTGAES